MTMTRQERINQAVQDVLIEMARAEHLHPIWPGVGREGDHVSAAALVAEEGGELQKDANNYAMHGRGSIGHMLEEAIHVAATAIRFIINLDAVEQRRTGYDDQPPSLDTACDLDDEHNVYSLPREGLTLGPDVVFKNFIRGGGVE
jgi:hypothetical protein